ncbi:MFS transporter [Epidermidibacterium keratini]|uniref:MFS transporter n=1 Tax=Epidermidibacterium keratini TaxID=1891644 RepID=A0A7L4YM30_9ACTN|nr:MFS transporter [Epidermidibacterium keratini]QHB99932.1 MFS transporter [Epidermidibacterium keratini]
MDSARFPGGRVVAGCFISLTTTSGLCFYGLAVYLNAFSKERGWSLSSISLATTVFFVATGFVGLAVARLITRYDARRVMVAGAIVGAIALALLGQVHEQWQLYLVYLLFAFGFGSAGLVPVTTVVTRWYNRRRSIALSIASTGLSVGGMVLTPLAKWLTDHVGLSQATPILAAVWLVGTVPVIVWLIRPDPAALGWLPDGARAAPDAPTVALPGEPYSIAIRTRFFRAMTAAYVLLMAAQVGSLQQLVKLAEERTGAVAAAFATFVVAAMSVIARLAGGRLVYRVPMGGFTVVLGVVQAVSLSILAFSYNTLAFFAMVVVFGATVGNILLLQSLLISHRFGVRDYARLFSRSQLFVVIGTAGGPLLLGWLYDLSGDYRLSYVVAGSLSLIGAAVMWWAGPAEEFQAEPEIASEPAPESGR